MTFSSSDGKFSSTVTVVQSQTDMIVSDPDRIEIDYTEQTFPVTVSANTEYEVTVTAGSEWLSRADTRSMVSTEFRFRAAKNPAKAVRTGTVRVAKTDGSVVRNVTVVQGANTEPLTVRCPAPGGLLAAMTEGELLYTTDLVVTGSISSADVGDVAASMPALTTLDLSDASVKDAYIGNIGFAGPLAKLSLPRTLVKMGTVSAEKLREVVMYEGLQRIEERAFTGCSSLASVELPSSVTFIGGYAFQNLADLTRLSLPDALAEVGPEAFAGTGLRSVRIPAGVEVLENAFNGCASLSQVTFAPGSRLRVMGSENPVSSGSPYIGKKRIPSGQLFFGCTALTSITVPASVEVIGGNVFTDCTSLRSVAFESGSRLKTLCGSTTRLSSGLNMTINYYGLFENTALESITLPASLTAVGDAAFRNSAVREVNYHNFRNITTIGNEAFAGSGIASVTVCNNVAYGMWVYSDCLNLTRVELPSSGEALLPREAFAGCTNLKSITVPAGCTAVSAVGGEFKAGPVFKDSGLETVEFEAGSRLVSLGPDVFSELAALKSLRLPEGLTELGEAAFYGCSGLTDVVLPESLTALPANAFLNCPSLRSINTGSIEIFGDAALALRNYETAPANYLSSLDLASAVGLGTECFYGRSALTSAPLPRTPVLNVGDRVFAGTGITAVVIPREITSLERTAGFDRPPLFGTLPVTFESGSQLRNIPDGMFSGYTFTEIELPQGLTEIGYAAFAECANLVSIDLRGGASMNISGSAFRGCTSLRTVRMPSSPTVSMNDKLFEGCSLQSVVFPSSVAVLNSVYSPFGGCSVGSAVFEPGTQLRAIPRELFLGSGLGSVTLADGIAEIGDRAFSECALTEVRLPASVERLGEECFGGNVSLGRVELPENARADFGTGCFSGCTRLTGLEFPAAVQQLVGREVLKGSSVRNVTFAAGSRLAEIGSSFFENSPALVSVGLPAGLNSIGMYAFADCRALREVNMASGPATVSAEAFRGCTALQSVVVPSGANVLGDSAFAGCTSLASVVLPSTLTDVGGRAFAECSALQSFALPASAELKLGSEVFSGCRFTELTIPSGLQKLTGDYDRRTRTYTFEGSAVNRIIFESGSRLAETGSYAFAGAPITEIELPEGVTSVGDGTFLGCSRLRSVVLPSTVAYLRSGRNGTVFTGCTVLSDLTCRMSVPAKVDAAEFGDVNTASCILKVPSSSVNLYKNASGDRAAWAKFVNVTGM